MSWHCCQGQPPPPFVQCSPLDARFTSRERQQTRLTLTSSGTASKLQHQAQQAMSPSGSPSAALGSIAGETPCPAFCASSDLRLSLGTEYRAHLCLRICKAAPSPQSRSIPRVGPSGPASEHTRYVLVSPACRPLYFQTCHCTNDEAQWSR